MHQRVDQQCEVVGTEAPLIHLQYIWFWQFTSDLVESGPLPHAPVTHRVQNFLKGSHSPKACFLNCRPLQRAACCAVTCQSSGHHCLYETSHAKKPSYSFQSRLKGRHVLLWFLSPCNFRAFGKEPLTHLSAGNHGQYLSIQMESKTWHLRLDQYTFKQVYQLS